MLAAVWRGPGRLAAEVCGRPEIEYDFDVVVRVRASVFGAALVRAVTVGHPRMTPPAVLGSLVGGDVVAIGSKVSNLGVGARIIVDPHPPCGICANCLSHEEALCLARPKIDPGGLAEYVRIRPPLVSHIRQIPPHISYAHAAFTEIVACVAEATYVGGVGFGDTVAVVGCGPVALLHIQLARLRGATQVICLRNHPERDHAISCAGGTPINATEPKVVDLVKELTGGLGADVVLEAVGRGETYALALELVRPGGAVIGFGGCPPGTRLSIDPNHLHYNGVRFFGSYHYAPGMFERAFRLISSGRVDLGSVITHELPIRQVAEAVAVATLPECVSLIIVP